MSLSPRPSLLSLRSGARVSLLRLAALLCGLLLLLAALSVQPACAASSHLSKPPRTDLMLFTSFVQDSFVQRAVLLYTLSRSTDEVRIRTAYKAATATANSVSNGFTAMKNAEADFAVLPAVATAATRATVPDFQFFPLFAAAYVAVVNLPDLVGAQNLVLSQVTVARIFQGIVKSWNDPMIVADNPSNVILPNKPIEVVFMKEAQSYIDTFIINMRLIDPLNFTIPSINTFSTPAWPTANYAKWKMVPVARDIASYVLSNPYSIGISYQGVASLLKASIVSLKNDYGNVVRPTYQASASAFAERSVLTSRAPDGSLIKAQPLDLLRPPGPNSWPWLQISTMVIPRTFSRSTCRARSELLKFLHYMLHSTTVTDTLSIAEGVVMVDDRMNLALKIEETLNKDTRCENNPVNVQTTSSVTTGGASALSMHHNGRDVLLSAYSIQKQETYSFQVMDEKAALEGTLDVVGQPDITWIFADTFVDLYPGVLEGYLNSGALTLVHVTVAGIVPIFQAPADIAAALKPSLPLVFDMETLALIFLGEIASWTNPRLSAHMPNLAAVYAGSATQAITVVVCGTGNMADARHLSNSNHFMQVIARTQAFRDLGFNYSLPADWRPMTARMAANGVRFEYVASEVHLEAAVLRIPGSIGYMLAASNFATIEHEIQIAMPVALDESNPTVLTWAPVAAIPDNYLACAAAQKASSSGILIPRTNSKTELKWKNCWPFVTFNSQAISTDVRTATTDRFGNTHVSSDLKTLCAHQKKVVELVRYWAFLPHVDAPLRLVGRAAVSELPEWKEEITRSLLSLNCGGEPVLWTRPIVWKLSSAVSMFGVAITLIGLILTVLVTALVIAYRRRTIIYSSTMNRQIAVLCGLVLLFATPVLFSAPPVDSTCNLLSWLLFLGASLTFGPICVRLRRVYTAHSKRKKSVRRQSWAKLRQSAPLFVLLVLDVIVLAIAAQSGGMLRSITFKTYDNGVAHEATLCSVPSSLLPHFGILCGAHLLMLLVTAVMAFQVRHVTTAYLESSNLSWAVWNAVLSTCLIVPLIVLTGGLQGDSGVFLLMFLVSWIALCTLGFDFGYKLWVLLGQEIALARDRASRSSRSGMTNSGKTTGSYTTGSGTGSGTTGLSILSMPILDGITSVSTIEQYIMALENQLRTAKDLRKLNTGASSGGDRGVSPQKSEATSMRQRPIGRTSEHQLLTARPSPPQSPARKLPVRSLDPSPGVSPRSSPIASVEPPSPSAPRVVFGATAGGTAHAVRPMVLFRAPTTSLAVPGPASPVARTPIRIGKPSVSGAAAPTRSPTQSNRSTPISRPAPIRVNSSSDGSFRAESKQANE